MPVMKSLVMKVRITTERRQEGCFCKESRPILTQEKPCVHYLISEFADELSVIVMRFDEFRLAAGKMRGALNEIGPQGTLGQENLFRLQIQLSYNFICHL
ncbi:hypothetical protein EYF80_020032 [Liparis tanakae]|uniref:Uncharacterized protein n=1 Tax=Liparis tanakae TaxID=230148 RepID=A0A4Z2HW26_9TELE|nr:hypothetical protein EYF80_020032 [Liparis tanakae]